MPDVSDMVWDVEGRAQRTEAMAEVRRMGFRCDIPPRRLGDRYTFRVVDVPVDRRSEVEAAVLRICPDATLES